MEYYIMKMYLQEKEKREDLEQGFNRLSEKRKCHLLILIGIMTIAYVTMCLGLFYWSEKIWTLIPAAVLILCVMGARVIKNNDEKENLDRYANTYEKKLAILQEILETKYGVNSKEKLVELINLYQRIVDAKEQEEKRKNTIVLTIFSVFAGICSITFTNLAVMGISFIQWLAVVIILLSLVFVVAFVIYTDILFDTIKKDYLGMIKDLEELKFKQY